MAVRFDMPDGKTLETHIKRLRSYLESQRKQYVANHSEEEFGQWARDTAAGALQNMSRSLFVEHGE